MPRKANAEATASCNIENVNRQWKEAAAVRLVAVKRDRLFESCMASEGENLPLKFSIKDAIHNQFVLIPVLRAMALDPKHPLPILKHLARESLS